MSSHIATSGRGDLDEAALNSLIIASNSKVIISPEIFGVIFNAWRQNEAVEIVYKKQDDTKSRRLIDPLIVAYNNYIWYIKGYCHKNKRIQVFAIHRIVEAIPLGKYYEPDNRLVESVQKNGLFDYPRIKNVKVRCHKDIRGYLLEQAESKGLIIEDDGEELIVTLPSVIEHELLHWVLGEAGKVEILEPESLREKALEAGRALLELHQK
jgi:predicted DNA-binding transcriptional regulator YafY